jgi:hypothetical protein
MVDANVIYQHSLMFNIANKKTKQKMAVAILKQVQGLANHKKHIYEGTHNIFFKMIHSVP